MNQRGRKSMAALAVVDGSAAISPIMAPAGLTQAELQVWLALVNSKSTDWFGTEHVPLMVEYVRHVCRGHVVDTQLRVFTDEWLATDEGLKRYKDLSGIATKTAAMIKTLATSMRLTQQTVYHKDKAGMGPKRGKVWQREPS